MEIPYATDTEVIRSEKDQRQQKNMVGYVYLILSNQVLSILSKDVMSYKTYYSKQELIYDPHYKNALRNEREIGSPRWYGQGLLEREKSSIYVFLV